MQLRVKGEIVRKFWGFYDNGKYKVGCNGRTIYVYNAEEEELARFRDITYAYVGVFHPVKDNIFVAKSTEGSLAVYDLEHQCLLKKIVITRIGAQDEGFAFSPDGSYFYNIEKPAITTRTQLTAYRTSDFEIENTWFSQEEVMCLDSIEFDQATGTCYILGFLRGDSGECKECFVGIFSEGEICEMRLLDIDTYYYIQDYKSWQKSGFTERSFEWSSRILKEADPIRHISLKELYETL